VTKGRDLGRPWFTPLVGGTLIRAIPESEPRKSKANLCLLPEEVIGKNPGRRRQRIGGESNSVVFGRKLKGDQVCHHRTKELRSAGSDRLRGGKRGGGLFDGTYKKNEGGVDSRGIRETIGS